jgi:NADPH:quinone reductase-like Zn-dependent oxidoreductase
VRAVQVSSFGGPEVLEVVELPIPTPIPTELLVEVHAAGVNPVDWKTRRGSSLSAAAGGPPFVPGWDVAGVVADAGYGVTTFDLGDRVFGMPWFPRWAGAYAEYVTAPSRQFARMPDGLSFECAAALPLASLTAWQALVQTAQVGAGQAVLVHGASGGVGHLAVQIAKARGATVIGTARVANHDFLRELGADECVDREAVPLSESASDVDATIDLVGGEEAGALRTVRDGGVLLEIAGHADEGLRAEAGRRGVRVAELLVEPDGHALGKIAALVAEGRLTPTVDTVLSLEEAAKAHEQLEAGGHRGKIVLSIR